ncbi:hypothetical protein LSH36_133g03021 [Paralvinella palmiformis]|uniref:Uncharacterized protein n=1 Tax=Paralvinella palmiformis TaxID=53620 RepID=A0AAD9JW59_9ANNE|nr:hypothetical protein LSH36_133g03021 [Paralvinella palmiformis]
MFQSSAEPFARARTAVSIQYTRLRSIKRDEIPYLLKVKDVMTGSRQAMEVRQSPSSERRLRPQRRLC